MPRKTVTKKPTKTPKTRVSDSTIVTIPALPVEVVQFTIVGKTPLLTNRFHPDDQALLEGSQTGKASKTNKNRDPDYEFEKSLWRLGDEFGYPAHNLLQCFVQGVRWVGGLTMTGTRGVVDIVSAEMSVEGDDLIPILSEGGPYNFRRTVGGKGGSKKAIKYCARFNDWRMNLSVSYDPNVVSRENLLLAWQCAGSYVGIGGWRPSCSGRFGQFQLEAG